LYFQVAKLPQVQNLSRELLLDVIQAVAEHLSDTRVHEEVSYLSLSDTSYS